MALLIANANHRLDTQLDKLQHAYERALQTAQDELKLKDIDVVCIVDKTMVIPEIGIGGYTPNKELTYLYVDPTIELDEAELYNTLCHEFHHAKRYEAMGYGATLFDSMIFEGLATAFEEEVSGKDAFMPSQLLSRKDTHKLVQKVQAHFNDTDFNHFKWFIFDATNELPRWAGYEVGYYLVREYLNAQPRKNASDLVLEPSATFYRTT